MLRLRIFSDCIQGHRGRRRAAITRLASPVIAGMSLFVISALLSCETHKDPFSASNSAPVITRFAFKPDLTLPDPSLRVDGDSLKFESGRAYPIALTYADEESKRSNRALRASFRFVAGGGRLSSNRFSNPSNDGLAFDVPAEFTDTDELFLIPDTSGIVDLQLVISDGVKDSELKTASTTFFENLAPVVKFSFQLENQGAPPYGVKLDASESIDRDGEIERYLWSFGDGTADVTTRSSSIHHDYQRSGTFTVRLRITDNEGAADSLDQIITTANQPPVAALSVTPTSGKAPLLIKYDARGSRDIDGTIASYDVTFGDGHSSASDTGSHQYTNDATYRVTLTVKDNLGASNSTTVTVTVATPPIAVLTVSPDSGAFPLSVQIDGSGSYDPLGGVISNPEIFINDQSIYDQLSVVHVFRRPDDYRVTLQIKNDRGLTGREEKVVHVTNTRPIADFTWVRDLGNVRFTSTSRDPNAPDDHIANYSWNFGDGAPERFPDGR